MKATKWLLAVGIIVALGCSDTAPTAETNSSNRDGKFEFTLNKVECGVKEVGKVLKEVAHGEFCLITITVKNISKEHKIFSDDEQYALDSNKNKYSANSVAGLVVNSDNKSFLEAINPGNQIPVTIVFDVPQGTKLSKLELHDSPFSSGVTINI